MAEATDLQRLIVSMEARSAKFERDLNKASLAASRSANQIEGRFRRMNTNLQSGFSAFSSAFTKAFALAGVGVGVAQLPRIIGDIVSEASALVDVADRIGLTTDQLQELHHAASLADIEVSELDRAMQFFGKTLGEAAQGNGELIKVLNANNVALRDGQGNLRSTNDLLFDYADLVKNAGSEQEQLRLAQIAFGRGGIEMVTALQKGADGLRENAEEARRLGVVLNEDLLRKAEALGDDWTRLTTTMSTAFKSFVLSVTNGVSLTIQDLDRLRSALNDPTGAKRSGAFVGGLFGKGTPADIDFAGRFAAPTARRTILPSQDDETSASAASARADMIQKVIEKLQFETEQLGRTNREQAIYNELSRAGVTINSDAGEKIAALSGALFDHEESLKAAKTAADEFNRAMEDVADDAFDAFESVITGAKSAKDAIIDLVKQLILAQAKASFLNAFGIGGSPLGPLAALFGGGRAMGGPISAGKVYKVHKDELIVPRVPGTVIPASRANAQTGGDININVTPSKLFDVHVDQRAQGVSTRVTSAALAGAERQRQRDQLRGA